ncbi:MAG: UvrD-helicase domain-containing protein, partial [Ruminococcus sp.]|nr:UvrD-helicase domain-containing protein [Ruminococcus sp.]
MPDMKWTNAQQNAINARDGSVLVSAAAGSGKTAVLVQRIIDSITDVENPVSIDRMLIVTFTRAASAEMRSRIESALNELLRSDPYNKYLLNQKQLLYSAKISTIDSFCSDFIRQYFYRLNIQSDFRIADEGELSILQAKALDNALETFYSENTPAFKNLVNSTCTYRNDDNLRKNILSTYNFLTSIPFMDNWMKNMLSYYEGMPFEDTPYCEYILDYARQCISYCKELVLTSYNYLEKDEFLEDKH